MRYCPILESCFKVLNRKCLFTFCHFIVANRRSKMFKDIAIYVCFLAIIASTGECQRTRSPTTKTTSSPVSENVPVVSDSTIALDQVSSTTVASTTPKPKPTPLRFFSSLGNSQYLGMPGKTSYKEYYMSEVQVR